MLSAIGDAIRDLANGKMIIVVDDGDRENEGDLVALAECATGETINFMAKYGRGLICVPMERERLEQLGLPQMLRENTDAHGTAFAVSVDCLETTTGISAYERALTIARLSSDSATAADFRKPGHVFPLAARDGGVLERRGHTEAAVDLAKLVHSRGCQMDGGEIPTSTDTRPLGQPENHTAVICEIMNDDGSMARMDDLEKFSGLYGLRIISIADLADWRIAKESGMRTQEEPRATVQRGDDAGDSCDDQSGGVRGETTGPIRCAETRLPTRHGTFSLYGYRNGSSGAENAALVMGDVSRGSPVLCRLHSECLTGDAFGSLRCDCGEQLESAMEAVSREGRGVIVYLRQEGRGIGLVNKLKAYALQDVGLDTVDANLALGFPSDARGYRAGAEILRDLGIRDVRLMTNNPEKIRGLESCGIRVTERIPVVVRSNDTNAFYLKTKRDRMNHIIDEEHSERRKE